METESVKLNSSAAVNRPQTPNEKRLPSVQGRIMYWHMGSKRKASATVAITANKSNRLRRVKHKINESLTGCANSEKKLHRVEKEKHDKQRYGSTQGQAQRMHRIQRGELIRYNRMNKIRSY